MNRIKHWVLQKRDERGRFLSYDGTSGKKYTIRDIEKAWTAGNSDRGFIIHPKDKLRRYLELNNIR